MEEQRTTKRVYNRRKSVSLDTTEELMSTKEATKELRRTPRWLYNQRKLGKIIPYHEYGNELFYRKVDVLNLKRQHTTVLISIANS